MIIRESARKGTSMHRISSMLQQNWPTWLRTASKLWVKRKEEEILFAKGSLFIGQFCLSFDCFEEQIDNTADDS